MWPVVHIGLDGTCSTVVGEVAYMERRCYKCATDVMNWSLVTNRSLKCLTRYESADESIAFEAAK